MPQHDKDQDVLGMLNVDLSKNIPTSPSRPVWSCGGCGHEYHGREGQGLTCSSECRCPGGDEVCQHGTASDVHCCGCHGGYIFDIAHDCDRELSERQP